MRVARVVRRRLDESPETRLADVRYGQKSRRRIVGADVGEHVAGVVVVLAMLEQQIYARVLRGFEQQLSAERGVVERVAVLVARNGVLHPAIVLVMQYGYTCRYNVAQRPAESALQLDAVVLAVG